MTARAALAVLLGTAILAGCGGTRPATAPETAPSITVQWRDYAPTVKSGIDQMAAAKDCPGLQSGFDAADANNAATMARVGHNNAQLMSYIDAAMKSAGCY